MARVVLADDHPLFLEALKAAVERAGIHVVATATRGDELLEILETVEADAVLLDLSMPGYDGFECMEKLRSRHPDLALVVVSGSDDEAQIRRAMDMGAICFVGKSTDPEVVAGAVHVMLSDSIYVRAPGEAAGPPNSVNGTQRASLLTRRELEILRLAAQGASNAEMARSLWVTEQTVKFHLSNIYRKLGVSNRTSASHWAQQQGLLDDVILPDTG